MNGRIWGAVRKVTMKLEVSGVGDSNLIAIFDPFDSTVCRNVSAIVVRVSIRRREDRPNLFHMRQT